MKQQHAWEVPVGIQMSMSRFLDKDDALPNYT